MRVTITIENDEGGVVTTIAAPSIEMALEELGAYERNLEKLLKEDEKDDLTDF